MESKEIMIKAKMPTFKSKALNTATSAIYEAINKYNTTAAETRKTVAVVLARVERNQTYKDDGFKSLAEYAEQIGMEKSLAHKLENAGRLLDSKDEAVRNFANSTDYSKLAIVSSAGEDAVKTAIESGELKPNQSQRDVRAWKDAHNAATAKAKVLPDLKFTVYNSLAGMHETYVDVETRETKLFVPSDYFKIGTVSGFSFYGDDPEKPQLDESAKWDVYQCKYAFHTVYIHTERVKRDKTKTPKAKALDPKSLSDEQLAAMIAEYNARRSAETGK